MRDASAARPGARHAPVAGLSTGRIQAGQLLIALATLGLGGVVVAQALYSFWNIGAGFDTWRPVLYVYVAWAVALGVGLVLARGERGHRALFLLPALLFTISMVVAPTILGFYIAFSNWNLSSLSGRQFNGIDNLRSLFQDANYWNAMLNMVYYSLSVIIQYAVGFGLALLLHSDIRGRKFFRVAFLLPFMLSPVAVSWMIGQSIFDPRFGPAASVARHLGWSNPAFFDTAWPARLTIMAMDAWEWIPFVMILMLAGLQALPDEVLEAAKVDGAVGWQSFWQITFPLMLPVSVTAVILRLIFELKLADIVLRVTGGGPGGATDTVTSFIYREYNDRSNVGYGTMLAEFYLIVIVVVMTVLLALVSRWMRKFS